MSFFASNSRIRVLDTNGDTSFDTNEDMPHIIGTAYVTNVGVTFTNMSTTNVYWYYFDCAYYMFTPDYCRNEMVNQPNPDYCYYESYEYCFYYYSGYESCYTNYNRVCQYNPPYVYYERICVPNPPTCVGMDYYQKQYIAREVSGVQDVVSLPVDEDGNPIDIDFIIIQATGSRTKAGVDQRISSNFLSTVPSGTFSFQGSALLESSARDDGSSWFRRIISVVVDYSDHKLKLKKQETVGTRKTEKESFTPNEYSNFNFNFKIFFGRFKS